VVINAFELYGFEFVTWKLQHKYLYMA